MLAAVCARISKDEPLTGLELLEIPEPDAADGWEIVEVRAAALNQHDIWSLRGVGVTEEGLPVVLGTDAAGVTADGREVVVHAVLGSAGPGEDETLAADFHLFSERGVQGTLAQRVAVPVTEPRPEACVPVLRRGRVPADRLPHRLPDALRSRPPAAGPVRARPGSGRRRRNGSDPARARCGHRGLRHEPERGEARPGARARRRRRDRAGRPACRSGSTRCSRPWARRRGTTRSSRSGPEARSSSPAPRREPTRRRISPGCSGASSRSSAPRWGRSSSSSASAPSSSRRARHPLVDSEHALASRARRVRPTRGGHRVREDRCRPLASQRRLGFIGLGNLGRPLAASLLAGRLSVDRARPRCRRGEAAPRRGRRLGRLARGGREPPRTPSSPACRRPRPSRTC